MSALLGHADAARCMARAFDERAIDAALRNNGEAATILSAMAVAYDRAAILMLDEARRQATTPATTQTAVKAAE